MSTYAFLTKQQNITTEPKLLSVCDENLMITLSNFFQFRSLFMIHRLPEALNRFMFKQLLSRGASVAQRIEHVPNESGDAGSIPARGTKLEPIFKTNDVPRAERVVA